MSKAFTGAFLAPSVRLPDQAPTGWAEAAQATRTDMTNPPVPPAGSTMGRAGASYDRCITKNASTANHGRPDVPRTRTVTVWLPSDVKIVWRIRLARKLDE